VTVIDAIQAVEFLKDKDLRVIEKRTGLRYSVLWRIKNGRVKAISKKTATALEAYQNG